MKKATKPPVPTKKLELKINALNVTNHIQQQQIISKPKPIAKSKVLHQKYELPKGILCKSTNSNGVPKQQPKPNKEKVEEKLNHFLSNIKSNIVYITVGNLGYLDLILNIYQTIQKNCSQATKDQFIVLTYDKKLIQELQTYPCINVFYVPYDITSSTRDASSSAVSYKEKDWNTVTRFKLLAIYTVLQANKKVMYIDPDVVLVRDPMIDIEQKYNNSSIMYNQEGSPPNELCSGIIIVDPKSKFVSSVFDPSAWLTSLLDDEAYIRQRTIAMKLTDQVEVLPFDDYPNGLIWTKYGATDEKVSRIIEEKKCVMFHYNHISGIDAKITRMKTTKSYIPTMKIIDVPKQYRNSLEDICRSKLGTAYPPHHIGNHLEEACEIHVRNILKTRLIVSEYVYLPIHWTAIGVSNDAMKINSLKLYCNSLFKNKGVKYWTVVQHCKGIHGSCQVVLPSSTKVFMTSDPSAIFVENVVQQVNNNNKRQQKIAQPVQKVYPKPLHPSNKIPDFSTQKPKSKMEWRQWQLWKRSGSPINNNPTPTIIPSKKNNNSSHLPKPIKKIATVTTTHQPVFSITVPLVCASHKINSNNTSLQRSIRDRDLLANFIGNIGIHPIRQEMRQTLQIYSNDVTIKQGEYKKESDIKEFEILMKRSKFALCPRGFGTTSFRLAEAMEFGCIPVYISDVFSLPFSDRINPADYCILIKREDLNTLYSKLENISHSEILRLQTNIAQYYKKYFTLDGCCATIIDYVEQWN